MEKMRKKVQELEVPGNVCHVAQPRSQVNGPPKQARESPKKSISRRKLGRQKRSAEIRSLSLPSTSMRLQYLLAFASITSHNCVPSVIFYCPCFLILPQRYTYYDLRACCI